MKKENSRKYNKKDKILFKKLEFASRAYRHAWNKKLISNIKHLPIEVEDIENVKLGNLVNIWKKKGKSFADFENDNKLSSYLNISMNYIAKDYLDSFDVNKSKQHGTLKLKQIFPTSQLSTVNKDINREDAKRIIENVKSNMTPLRKAHLEEYIKSNGLKKELTQSELNGRNKSITEARRKARIEIERESKRIYKNAFVK